MPLRFDVWMHNALYDPKRGYYSRRIETVGGRGDFTTAPILSDALAHAIGKWAYRAMQETGARDLIEIGPGNGTLAKAVWKSLPWIRRRKTRLHLVETSAPLEKQQRELLGDKVIWHKNPATALEACDGKAVIYSNELVDAFPCRRFEHTAGGWREIAVEFNRQGRVNEILMDVDELPESSIFQRDFPSVQRIEIHESYRKWLEGWLPLWKAGRMLTIDYGAEAKDLYPRQPDGSMRAYLLQERLT
ncbi:MAG: SAM-dependent methyltransferase, partial [Akkermansiaceae bacterium]|nr:SAM-dependent methyltransferase [Akkermansiaceae bacterium]